MLTVSFLISWISLWRLILLSLVLSNGTFDYCFCNHDAIFLRISSSPSFHFRRCVLFWFLNIWSEFLYLIFKIIWFNWNCRLKMFFQLLSEIISVGILSFFIILSLSQLKIPSKLGKPIIKIDLGNILYNILRNQLHHQAVWIDNSK